MVQQLCFILKKSKPNSIPASEFTNHWIGIVDLNEMCAHTKNVSVTVFFRLIQIFITEDKFYHDKLPKGRQVREHMLCSEQHEWLRCNNFRYLVMNDSDLILSLRGLLSRLYTVHCCIMNIQYLYYNILPLKSSKGIQPPRFKPCAVKISRLS